MKVRNGFVSNSSSSSFCIIGTARIFDAHRLAEAEGLLFRGMDHDTQTKKKRACKHPEVNSHFCPECGELMWLTSTIEPNYIELYYGYHEGKVVTFYDDGDYGIGYAGIEATKVLEELSLKQARDYFCGLVKKKLGVELTSKTINLYYGEAGNG